VRATPAGFVYVHQRTGTNESGGAVDYEDPYVMAFRDGRIRLFEAYALDDIDE